MTALCRYGDYIMMSRTQISLDPEQHRRAQRRAAALGISLSEYLRRLIARDTEEASSNVDRAIVFDLGDSGGADIATRKDAYLGAAFLASRARPAGRTRRSR